MTDKMKKTDKITTEQALKSAKQALWVIANMQILESTDKGTVLDHCMSTAAFELEKLKYLEAAEKIEAKAENL